MKTDKNKPDMKYKHKTKVTMRFELCMDASKIEKVTVIAISESSAKRQGEIILKRQYQTNMVRFLDIISTEDGRR